MYYIVNTDKTLEKASADLESEVKNLGFGVLHIHDLGETLRSKGVTFEEDCRVFEICNPKQAVKVLSVDMKLNMALPCRVSIYTENGSTRIDFIKPTKMLSAISKDPNLNEIAQDVESKLIQMINASK